MKIFFISLLLIFTIHGLNAAVDLPFVEIAQDRAPPEKAKAYNGQEVSIRGFLYQTADGTWILSTEPNLKTCCVGSKQKAHKQIVLEKKFEGTKTDQPVTIKGIFNIHDGDHPFFVTNAVMEEVPQTNWSGFWLLPGSGFILITLVLMRRRKAPPT